jgi:two-component system chemotaxis response regulator CheB
MAPPWFIAIGASGSDGLIDIKTLLHSLPPNLHAVILVVLHRAWDRVSHLRAVLAAASPYPVVIAIDGENFKPGTVYIGEPGDHLKLAAASFGTILHDPERLYRNRTIDLLFGSVAAFADEKCIGIILSGSLDDGSRGLAAIHKAGGLTMAVRPKPGDGAMPANAIQYDGPVSAIGNPAEIAAAIYEAVRGHAAEVGG